MSQDPNDYNSENLLLFIFRWKKPLLIITLIGLICSVAISFLITPRYKSTAIIFPAPDVSLSKSIIKEWDDVLKLGDEKEVEQLLQILLSDNIRENLNSRINLIKHYNINSNDPLAQLELKNTYEDNISFTKTEYSSIEITVYDKDKDTAALIANTILDIVDSTKRYMLQERALQAYNIVKNQYNERLLYIKKMEDSLNVFIKQGLFDYEVQSKEAFKAHAKAMISGNSQASKVLDEKMKLVQGNGWNYVMLRDHIIFERELLNGLNEKMVLAQLDLKKYLPVKYIVNKATPALKKAYPIRWLIVLVSTISTLIGGVIFLSLFESVSKIKFEK